MAVQFTKLSVSPEVVQTTGTSETAVMSQKAVTDALASAGGGSGGLVLKSVNLGTSTSNWYSKLRPLITNGIRDIKVTMSITSDTINVTTDVHTVNLSTLEHSYTNETWQAFRNGVTYVFSVVAYKSDEIQLSYHGNYDGLYELVLKLTEKNCWVEVRRHNINTYSHTEEFRYGYTTITSVPRDGKAYYYDTE